MSRSTDTITVREARAGDTPALRRLAALDSADVPTGRAMLALVDGTPVAALDLETGAAVADPFRRTADVVDLMRARTRHAAAPSRHRRGLALRRLSEAT